MSDAHEHSGVQAKPEPCQGITWVWGKDRSYLEGMGPWMVLAAPTVSPVASGPGGYNQESPVIRSWPGREQPRLWIDEEDVK